MKTSRTFLHSGKAGPARHASNRCLAALVVVLIGISWDATICPAQQPGDDAPGVQVLTRGPVHEAFAGMVTFNPEPGIVLTKAPPNAIEELPPGEKPEGDNVTWIPGYWAWDDERNDFLWVSGIWRNLPPGREWRTGYWGKTPQGYQWTSGYWADATAQETTYLPPPPATVEVGPNIAAPSMDYGWMPGCWVWYQARYAWRPGYWAQGRADWNWMPDHYVWTPRGYIFVGGYWDYPIERRGILFAPVYFESGVYSRRGYFYSPTIVISLGVFTDSLFLRPRYHHYYFGDYYAASYTQGGFYASFSFQSSRYGYDPIYSHQRWEHRQDREWEHRIEASYQDRRDHEAARPPRTWAAQRTINAKPAPPGQSRAQVAMPMDQLTKRNDGPVRFQPVSSEERQQLVRRGQEVQQSRDQRRTAETGTASATARKPGGGIAPATVQLPRSPIVARAATPLKKDQPPAQTQRTPQRDQQLQPKSESPGRQPNADRRDPQPQVRPAASAPKPAPARSEAPPSVRQPRPESNPRTQKPSPPTQATSERSTRKIVEPARQVRQRPAVRPAVPGEKGASRLLGNDTRRKDTIPRTPGR